jgi:hypothetical protein
MNENTEVWASWMTALGVLAVIIIFGSAYLWVSAIRKGNRGFRFWQRSGRETGATNTDEKYPSEPRDDLR